MTDRDRLIKLIVQANERCSNQICEVCEYTNNDQALCDTYNLADHLLANGVILPAENEIIEISKKVYFPFPIDCEKCPKMVADIEVCKELDLLYAGEHPKYSEEQDWEFMCENCPHEVIEREYQDSDDKHIGKTVFLTKEEAKKALAERSKG